MYYRFDSLAAAYQFLHQTYTNQRLWSILHFGAGPFYVFTSTAAPGGQMFNIARRIATMSGHYGPGMPHGRDIATHLTDVLVARANATGMVNPGGHAEEWLITHFPEVLAQAGNPSTAIILNSDSPCTLLESIPSATLQAWPVSCARKLGKLAANNPAIDWSVFYMRRFGAQGAHNTRQIAQYFQRAVKDFEATRIAIYPYTAAMQAQVSTHGRI